MGYLLVSLHDPPIVVQITYIFVSKQIRLGTRSVVPLMGMIYEWTLSEGLAEALRKWANSCHGLVRSTLFVFPLLNCPSLGPMFVPYHCGKLEETEVGVELFFIGLKMKLCKC